MDSDADAALTSFVSTSTTSVTTPTSPYTFFDTSACSSFLSKDYQSYVCTGVNWYTPNSAFTPDQNYDVFFKVTRMRGNKKCKE